MTFKFATKSQIPLHNLNQENRRNDIHSISKSDGKTDVLWFRLGLRDSSDAASSLPSKQLDRSGS